jgi:tetratricopeptide (TPR) repeat protein
LISIVLPHRNDSLPVEHHFILPFPRPSILICWRHEVWRSFQEGTMRKVFVIVAIAFTLSAAGSARAQLVRGTTIHAGSPEDQAMDAISAATDPAQKLALIDKFMADYGQGDMAIIANELYVSYYADAKDYAKMADYSQKILAADPDNFNAAIHLARAESELGNIAALFDAGEKMNAIIVRYKAQKPPADAIASEWQSRHDQALADQHDQIEYVRNILANAVFRSQTPAEQAAYGERFAADFPDSPYAASCEFLAARAYQQLQNAPKMIAASDRVLSMDPNNVDALILLADYYSDKGVELDKADADAKKAIELLPTTKKPDNFTDDQWRKQISLQTGIALSAEGQVLINRNDLDGAQAAFQKASPLLKENTFAYARNLYRLGFTYARLKKVPEATAALTEAASLNTPFKALAQQTLQQLQTSSAPAKKTSHE